MRLLVTGTGTGVGKTQLTRALALALRARGEGVVALKPVETGCDPEPSDAIALAEACGRPELAHLAGLYRARAPLSPYAATKGGEPAFDWRTVTTAVRGLLDAPNVLVEGAGGLLVPLDGEHSVADLAVALDLPIALVTCDQLGVLSHTLTALECARHRGLRVAAVILRSPADPDYSTATNIDVLTELTGAPVLYFPHAIGDSELAAAGGAILSRMRPDP